MEGGLVVVNLGYLVSHLSNFVMPNFVMPVVLMMLNYLEPLVLVEKAFFY
jgi:hypothetical protein